MFQLHLAITKTGEVIHFTHPSTSGSILRIAAHGVGLLMLLTALAYGETSPGHTEHADVIFDLNLSDLVSTELFLEVDWSDFISVVSDQQGAPNLAGQVHRLTGLIQVPTLNAGPDQNCDLLIAIHCKTNSTAASLATMLRVEEVSALNHNGTDFFPSERLENFAPLLVGVNSQATVLLGSRRFLESNRRSQLLEAKTRRSWKSTSEGPIRIAANMEKISNWINAVASANGSDHPELHEISRCTELIGAMCISLLPADQSLFVVTILPRSADGIDDARSRVDGVLTLMRIASQRAMRDVGFKEPDVDVAIHESLDELKTLTKDGAVVIRTSKPRNLHKVSSALKRIVRLPATD